MSRLKTCRTIPSDLTFVIRVEEEEKGLGEVTENIWRNIKRLEIYKFDEKEKCT